MMHAYSSLYLEKAQIAMGDMLQYVVYDLSMDLSRFYRQFLYTDIARSFGSGDPKYVAGMSGVELAMEVIFHITGKYPKQKPTYAFDKSPEYWAGWAVAYYEWYSAIPFNRIEEFAPITQIREMYHPYHEMDITKFVSTIDVRKAESRVSRLARLRAYADISQKALAEQSGVSVRMIEQYEQGRKDINNASSATVYKLSRALHCRMEDLIG